MWKAFGNRSAAFGLLFSDFERCIHIYIYVAKQPMKRREISLFIQDKKNIKISF